MKPFKELTFAQLMLRSLSCTPFAVASMVAIVVGDTRGILPLTVVGLTLFLCCFVWIGLCAYHGFVRPIAFDGPLPRRRGSDGEENGAAERDALEREELRERMRAGRNRALVVFPVFAIGLLLSIVGEQTSRENLLQIGTAVSMVGFVLFAVVVMSGMLPIMRDLMRR